MKSGKEKNDSIIEKKKIIDIILGSEGEFSLKERVYNSLFFISSLVVFILFLGDIIQGLGFKIYIASLLGSILFGAMYFVSRKWKLHKLLIHFFNLFVVAAFIYHWYYSGGIDGLSLIIMLPMIGVIPVFVNGISRIFGIFFLISIGFVLLLFEINHPNFVQTINDSQTRLIDKFTTALLISFSILGVVFLILQDYNKEHRKVVKLNKSKDKLLSVIAHDLRNPIGAINELTNLLLRRHDEMNIKERERFITTMSEAIQGTYDLLENLLLWARSETGDLEVNKENLQVNNLIEKSVLLLTESANQKNIKITVNAEENLFLYADQNMLDTTIRNLISNAIKFSEEGNEIVIKVNNSNEKLQISIADHGVGMNKKVLDSLIENEKTISTRGTNKETGTGFGLKLCNEFVKRNNGQLLIKSEEGIGTEVTLEFPLKS